MKNLIQEGELYNSDLFTDNKDGEIYIINTINSAILDLQAQLKDGGIFQYKNKSQLKQEIAAFTQLKKIVLSGCWIDSIEINDVTKLKKNCDAYAKHVINSTVEFYDALNKHKQKKEFYTVFTHLGAIKQVIHCKLEKLKQQVIKAESSFFKSKNNLFLKKQKIDGLNLLLTYFKGENADDKSKYDEMLKQTRTKYPKIDEGVFSDIAKILYGIEKYYQAQQMKHSELNINVYGEYELKILK